MVLPRRQRADKWEYGIKHHLQSIFDPEMHRQGMTLEEARQWIEEWEADGGRADAFSIVRRPITLWEEVL